MRARVRRIGGGIALALGLASCSDSFGMPRGVTQQAHDTFHLWQVFFVTAIPVAGMVYALIAWSLVRYRRRPGDDPAELGAQFREHIRIEAVYTAVPLAIVVALFALSLHTNEQVTEVVTHPDLVVKADAYTWGWRFTYPDGVVVQSPPSGEFSTQPTIVLPRGETIRFSLTSSDTIHAFWVPAFLYKHDAIPGRTFEFDVTPTADGTYDGHCAEFCGLNHAYMGFTVRVVEPSEFTTWMRQQEAAV